MNATRLLVNRLSFLLISGSILGCSSSEQAVQNVGLCYVPFGAQTYAPISRSQLSYTCDDLGMVVVKGKGWEEIVSLIQKPSKGSTFDDNIVRLRIQLSSGEPIFVNQDGEMIRGEKTYQLSTSAMEDLTEQMEDLLRKKLPH